jgi:uncharacterized protein (TIGR00269 family)
MDTKDRKFMDDAEKRIADTIKKFKLFSKDDKVGVAVSGGKDSTVCLYVLKKLGYNIIGITVDAVIGNYTKQNLENLRKTCKKYGIKLEEISFKDEFGHSLCYLKSILQSKGNKIQSCALCGVLRKYLLNKYARKLKFDCIATGHNLDDEAQSFVMNIFRNDINAIKRQGPVSGVGKSEKFVRRVKPLFFVREDEAKKYSKLMGFPVNYERCPCSVDAFRKNFRDGLTEVEQTYPKIKEKIVGYLIKNISKGKNMEKNIEMNSCSKCGEPCKESVCRACQIIGMLTKD